MLNNPKLETWLKDLAKLGPSESSVLIIVYGNNVNKEELEQEIVWEQIKPFMSVSYSENEIPSEQVTESLLVIIDGFINSFSSREYKQLFNACSHNVIIFFQQDHLDNFDPEFIEDYCTVIIV